MTPSDLAAAFLALDPAGRAAFVQAAGLGSKAHSGSRRTKSPIKDSTRALVYAREGYCCYWCGVQLSETGAHFDHVRRVRGSDPVYLMGVASCPDCNVRRPADEQEAAAVAAELAGRDMAPAYALRDSEAGRAAYAAVKRASMGIRPAGLAVPF